MMNKSAYQPATLPKNLKRTFENAARDIYQAGLTGKIFQYRAPIVQRAGVPSTFGPNAEKQALSDARQGAGGAVEGFSQPLTQSVPGSQKRRDGCRLSVRPQFFYSDSPIVIPMARALESCESPSAT